MRLKRIGIFEFINESILEQNLVFCLEVCKPWGVDNRKRDPVVTVSLPEQSVPFLSLLTWMHFKNAVGRRIGGGRCPPMRSESSWPRVEDLQLGQPFSSSFSFSRTGDCEMIPVFSTRDAAQRYKTTKVKLCESVQKKKKGPLKAVQWQVLLVA